jgi:hypothetical protein
VVFSTPSGKAWTKGCADRWDRASVHTFEGTYGDCLLVEVGKVFPALRQRETPTPRAARPGASAPSDGGHSGPS